MPFRISATIFLIALGIGGGVVQPLHPAEVGKGELAPTVHLALGGGSSDPVGGVVAETRKDAEGSNVVRESGTTTATSLSGIRGVYADVTFYTPRETCPGGKKRNCQVAWRKIPLGGLEEGRTVTCPRKIPFGTAVRIFGADLVCEDRTSLRFDDRFDIFIEDYALAKEIGIHKNVEVLILDP